MHMSTLTRRTQLLLDEDRYTRLEQRAAESGRSVAAIIREAIDEKLADSAGSARRREAAQTLLRARAPEGEREPDWADVKNDLRDRAGH
jgi:hypothetical protein